MRRPFFNAFGNAKLAVAVLLLVVAVETLLIIILGIGLARVPTHLKIQQENCDGTINIIDPNKISLTTVLNFTSQEWVNLNSWAKNGTTDSVANLKAGDVFLTPSFIKQYKASLKNLNDRGYMDKYVLVTIPIQSNDLTNVVAKDGGWLVRQKFISRFYFNPTDTIDSDKTKYSPVEYKLEQDITFYVVQYPNDEGLAIDHIVKAEDADSIDDQKINNAGADNESN
jgi:hypothetical protein